MTPLDYFHIPGNVPENGQMENKDDDDDETHLPRLLLAGTDYSLPLMHEQ